MFVLLLSANICGLESPPFHIDRGNILLVLAHRRQIVNFVSVLLPPYKHRDVVDSGSLPHHKCVFVQFEVFLLFPHIIKKDLRFSTPST